MSLRTGILCASVLCVFAAGAAAASPTSRPADEAYWFGPMRQVHAKFTGKHGTFANFGDSITVTLAYWAPLRWEHKSISPEGQRALDLVNSYMLKECFNDWKGPRFGSEGSMTIRWAHQNVDQWLKSLNPEVALIMFGTNDLNQIKIDEYETKTRQVVRKCLDNGTVVILSTIPPRSGQLEKCRQFAAVVRKIARDMKVPLVDFFAECLKRRPDDWDGTAPKFKVAGGDVYQVLTLISGDGVHPSNPKKYVGDFSEEALNTNGFGLRTYLSLLAYADVIENVLKEFIGRPV